MKTIKELCFPSKFEYQLPQKFVKNFINPKTDYKSLLIYHKIGSGKTCAAIQIAEQWVGHRKIYIITPASLISNMYKEFRSLCTHNHYVSASERETLKELNPTSPEYLNLIKEINKRIDSNVNIISYNKFINKINNQSITLRNSLIIIDEIHNIISDTGVMYQTLYNFIQNAPESLRIVLLSATPIVDQPSELALLINLLKPKHTLPVGKAFNKIFIDNNQIINQDILQKHIKGYVSYYKGAPAKTFPLKQFRLVNCHMSDYQYAIYNKIKLNENIDNFYINSRIASNTTLPKINSLNLNISKSYDLLEKYSCKLLKLLIKLKYARGTVFIYSNFKEVGGIKMIAKVLEDNGYSNYENNGPGTSVFAIWTGDETVENKDNILSVFNNVNNQNGSKIKILLGSPSIKEGISLMRVRQVHILEPHWNMSRIQQIIGRAIRFCSHASVKPKRRTVKIFLYIACLPENIRKEQSIDQYILDIAHKKEDIIKQFDKLLIDYSVDKLLY